jgi:hypothetical protein
MDMLGLRFTFDEVPSKGSKCYLYQLHAHDFFEETPSERVIETEFLDDPPNSSVRLHSQSYYNSR